MALVSCSECGGPVSAMATACPKCGHPTGQPSAAASGETADPRRSPVFLIFAIASLALALWIPRLLLFVPLVGVMCFAAISFFRREKGRALALVVAALGAGMWYVDSAIFDKPGVGIARPDANEGALDTAEVVSFNWRKEPNFGTNGTIKWNVEIKNRSDRYVESVRVEFATYDNDGKLVASTFAFVSAIPPGASRSTQSYADLYRTEAKANVNITNVRYAR